MIGPGEEIPTYSTWSLVTTVGGEALPRSVDESLQRHFERIGMGDELAEAYSAAHTPVYASGLGVIDGSALSSLNMGKVKTAHALATDYRFLVDPDEYFMASMPGTTKRQREQIAANANWDNDLSNEWTQKAVSEQHGGFAATPALEAIGALTQLSYAPELGSLNIIPSGIFDKDAGGARQLSGLFTVPEMRAGVSATLVCAKMREAGMMDTSRAHLDARTENLHKVLQVDMGAEAMRMISDMWSATGGARNAAQMLFHRYRAVLLQDNFPAKQAMLQDVRTTLLRLATRPRIYTNERKVLAAHATRMAVFSSDVARLRGMYATVYQRLGYDTPLSLTDLVPMTAQEAAVSEEVIIAAAGGVAVEAVTNPEPDAEVVAALQAQGAQLVLDSAQANRAWSMTGKERKNASLDGAVRTLMAGSRDAVGQTLLSAMDRQEAEAFVAVLRRLDAMGAKGADAGRQALAAALDRRSEVASQTRTLREQVGRDAPGATIAYPTDSIPVERHIQAMRGDWRRYEQVLLAIWPAATVRQTITNIRSVLFTPEA